MGFSIAEELADEGAIVDLVAGPTSLKTSSKNITRYNVVSAKNMYDKCTKLFGSADITIMAAAVADYTPLTTHTKKIKKEDAIPVIELKPSKDILAELGKEKKKNQILIGFALETDNELANAQKKLTKKNLDFIVMNSLQDKGAGFGTKTNKISIISKNNIQQFELKTKQEVAQDIIDKIIELL